MQRFFYFMSGNIQNIGLSRQQLQKQQITTEKINNFREIFFIYLIHDFIKLKVYISSPEAEPEAWLTWLTLDKSIFIVGLHPCCSVVYQHCTCIACQSIVRHAIVYHCPLYRGQLPGNDRVKQYISITRNM
jgi:hypothetical protein